MVAQHRQQWLLGCVFQSCDGFQPALHAFFKLDRILADEQAAGLLERKFTDDLDRWISTIRLTEDAEPSSSNHQTRCSANAGHVLAHLSRRFFDLVGAFHLHDKIVCPDGDVTTMSMPRSSTHRA